VLPGIFLITERYRGHRLLTERLEQLKAANERLSVEDFMPKALSPEENSAVILLGLTNLFGNGYEKFYQAQSLFYATPGMAVPTWRFEYWPYGNGEACEWKELDDKLSERKEELKLIREGLSRPGYYDGDELNVKPIMCARRNNGCLLEIRWILDADMNVALHRGELARAQMDLIMLIRLAKVHMNSGFLQDQYMHNNTVCSALEATWAALQAPGWTEAALRELQIAWQGFDPESDYLKVLELDRVLWMEYYQNIRRSSNDFLAYMEYVEESRYAMRGWALQYMNLPLWRFAWSDLEESYMLDYHEKLISQARWSITNTWTNAPFSGYGGFFDQRIKDANGNIALINKIRFLSVPLQYSFGIRYLYEAKVRHIESDLLHVAIALKRYQLHEGKYPDSLTLLVPSYLSALPLDRADGKLLRYKRRDADTFLLYSVGSNCIDDGGDASIILRRPSREIRGDGKDIVWPQIVDYENIPDSALPAKRRHRR
jgi:hypothetical protein